MKTLVLQSSVLAQDELCAGGGALRQATPSVVHRPQPPPGLQKCLPAPVYTGRPRLKFSPVCLIRDGAGLEDQTSVTGGSGEAAAGVGRVSLDSRPECPETHGQLWKLRRLPRARTAGRACSGLPRGGCQPSRSAQALRLPSASKVLLIKPVHLITGRSNKYLSRCFRCSLWALVKAAEASDQGCRPCSAGAAPARRDSPGSRDRDALAHSLNAGRRHRT